MLIYDFVTSIATSADCPSLLFHLPHSGILSSAFHSFLLAITRERLRKLTRRLAKNDNLLAGVSLIE